MKKKKVKLEGHTTIGKEYLGIMILKRGCEKLGWENHWKSVGGQVHRKNLVVVLHNDGGVYRAGFGGETDSRGRRGENL